MRSFAFLASLFVAALATSCASSSSSCCSKADPQVVVDDVAKANPGVVRLTVHCMQDGKLTACASTLADKKGKPSDPEDQQAIDGGQPVVKEEAAGLDVTVPILQQDGKFTVACGVTFGGKGMARDAAVQQAQAIAKAVETGLGGCCGTCNCK
jgi:hypothetical protein